jgi:tetratricopeptide (TPR) repeat protein
MSVTTKPALPVKLLRLGSAAALAALVAGGVRAQQQAPTPTPAQDAAQRELQAIQDLLARATAEFEGPQQSRSIVLLDDIISRLESLRRQGTLLPRGREILLQSYELRARAYFNIGLQEKASDSFRSLIQIQPQYTMSRDKVSPKIVDFFGSVKKALVGYLAVSSHPAGARVTLNGEFLSLTDFFPLEVLAGEYIVEVTRDGYRAETRSVSIAPRATEALEVDLVRTAASAWIITEPAAVEVWIDGELRTTTAGSLDPEFFEGARAKGVDPAKASARTEIVNLSLGSHVVEFRKKCHESSKTTIDFPDPQDYDIPPVRMEESLASLTLKSDPPGARIFLDGEAMGVTPRELDGVCSGKHRLEVKHISGKFIKDLVLAKDEGVTLDCPIRPSLAFLGVVAESSGGERNIPDVEEKLIQNLAITTLNFIPAPRETVDRILEAEKITRRGLVSGGAPGADADLIRKVSERLASALDVQGFLVAVLPEERLQRTAILHLLAAGNTVPDPWDVTFAESASYLRFISAVDQKATLSRPWTGMILVDTLMHDGVPVLRLVAGGPAAQAGIQTGEILFAADGKPVKRAIDFLSLVDSRKPKDRMSLHLRGAGGATRALELTLGETPQEIPLNDTALLYNKVMMDLRQQVDGYPGTEGAAFARFNLALCAMHFGDYAASHSHLIKAKSEMPQRPGLSQGTALYYLGFALESLGTEYRKEAVDAYRAASGFKDATLFNNDGPAVAPLAARRAGP